MIVAVPLAPNRFAERGFNQSILLASALAKRLRLPVAHAAMLRIRETPPQTGLTRKDRKKNIKGAFDSRALPANARVAIVDDVMTTGATLSEAARVLKRAGASRVEAWVIARAAYERKANAGESAT
jgi:ComF family protein